MTTATIEIPKIYGAISAIQKEMPTLQKNGVGPSTQGSYKFLSIDDILQSVKGLLNDNSVVVIPNLIDKGFHFNAAADRGDGRVPAEAVHAWVEYDFAFTHAEDGSSIHAHVIGEGKDSQDKAIRKATTSAWKIALIQTFALITGEPDPDAQDGANVPETAARVSPAQQKIESAKVTATAGKTQPELIRAEIKAAAKAREMTDRGYMDLGKKIAATAGAKGDTWINDVDILQALLKAIEAGEVA